MGTQNHFGVSNHRGRFQVCMMQKKKKKCGGNYLLPWSLIPTSAQEQQLYSSRSDIQYHYIKGAQRAACALFAVVSNSFSAGRYSISFQRTCWNNSQSRCHPLVKKHFLTSDLRQWRFHKWRWRFCVPAIPTLRTYGQRAEAAVGLATAKRIRLGTEHCIAAAWNRGEKALTLNFQKDKHKDSAQLKKIDNKRRKIVTGDESIAV